MDRLTKPKEFLEKLRLSDSDYQDSGMINHIADLLERYHAEQLRLGAVRDWSIERTYPRALYWDRYTPDETIVRLEIQTNKPLGNEFYEELSKLLDRHCS